MAEFVQVPPQSTGKKVAVVTRVELPFDNQVDTINVGDVVVGAVSGASGTVTAIVTEGYPANAGLLYLKDVSTISFQNNESIQVSAVTKATSNISNDHDRADYQKMIVTDPENPNFMQKVDRFGATINTFTDGSPVFGAFGTMTVGEPQTIKEYKFPYDTANTQFYDQMSGGGSLSYEANASVVLLGCGTSSGDLIRRTSNFYHPYSPGIGQRIEMTVRIGDTGKAGVRRRWGYFDDNDGVFWELANTSLSVVMRSSVTGSVVDTKIAQADFSEDPLDGSDSIGLNLDVSKPNIYWIDLQWLGSGRVRFGVVEPTGARITAHILENSNISNVFPYMRSGSLPLRIEQENTAASGSNSEMRFACAGVFHSSRVIVTGGRNSIDSGLKSIDTTDNEIPILALRPKKLFKGKTNRALAKLTAITISNVSDFNQMLQIRLYNLASNSALTGDSFTEVSSNSPVEYDVSATAFTPGQQITTFTLTQNQSLFAQNPDPRELHALELFLNGDGNTQPIVLATAQTFIANTNTIIGINFEEIVT